MDFFSYSFYILWISAFVLYFFWGRRYQWQILTVASVVFYGLSIKKIPMVLVLVWLITYFSARYVVKSTDKKRKICFWAAIIISIGALITGRETSAFAMLGNSYFVFKAIGYLIDVYHENPEEKNIFKYLLYLIYWPTICEGPFNRIASFLSNFKEPIQFDYKKMTHGVQRFIWGVFKKLVIAERFAFIANPILEEPVGKGGRFVIVAVIAFAIQLYADFSGCMDMMLGVSQTFGITLPENFKQPFFSKSIPEFWRRWHITLGLWCRDYIMFPFVSCAPVKRLSRKIRKKNKELGKLLPLIAGTSIVWIFTGLWHGSNTNFLIWGIYYAVIMSVSLIRDSKNKKLDTIYRPIVSKIVNCGAVLRTIVIFLIGDSIICVHGLSSVKNMWREIILNIRGGEIANIINGDFGLVDLGIVFIGVILILIISVLKEKGYEPLEILDKAPLIIRWGAYYALIFSIFLLGYYGTQYDTSQFLYMQY